jgi:hypothetical protein
LITSSKLVADKAIYALRGFRSIDNQVYTYLQERAGFSYFYPKRKVLADGVCWYRIQTVWLAGRPCTCLYGCRLDVY